jgi:threonine aldolase
LAEKLKTIKQIEIAYPIHANSVFVKIPKLWLKPLREHTFFYVWDETEFIMRWMLSFDVQQKDIDAFLVHVGKLSHEL